MFRLNFAHVQLSFIPSSDGANESHNFMFECAAYSKKKNYKSNMNCCGQVSD